MQRLGILKKPIFMLASYHLISDKVFSFNMVEGPSMLPTFNIYGDVVVTDFFYFKFYPIKRFDIAVYTPPEDASHFVLKRVIGLPGDELLEDTENPYSERFIVPTGHIWALGDNQVGSKDSRHYGPVPMALIRGIVVYKFRPFWNTNIKESPNAQVTVKETDID